MTSADDSASSLLPRHAHGSLPERLAREHAWLRRLARRLVGEGAPADDLAQETLRIALEKGPRVQSSHAGGMDRAGLRRWLASAARRTALLGWRSDAGRVHREQDVARAEQLPSAAVAVANAEARGRLVDAVLALDAPLRNAVLLRYFEGLGYGDVAEQLGVRQPWGGSVGWVAPHESARVDRLPTQPS